MLETRLPFHRHLKWLCLEDFEYERVRAFYDNLQIVPPAKAQYEDVKDSTSSLIIPPLTLRRLAKNIYKAEDESVWEKLGLKEIYLHRLGKFDWSEVGRLLSQSPMRVAVDACLTIGLTSAEISQMLPLAYAMTISEKGLDLYRKYFFEFEDMSRGDWNAYLELLREDKYTYTRIYAALTKPKNEVLHLVGLPTQMQFGSMLKNIMNTAHYKFEYFARQGSPEAQEDARKWAKVLMEAGVRHEKFSASDVTDFSKLIQTEFEYVETPIPTVEPEMIANVKPQITAAQDGDRKDVPIPITGAKDKKVSGN